ncbi:MAG: helix-turn-helix transcriptional regulator [Ruminococcaceae bacterium]|nr:helix-turn-helix transcriptional regulator [Oscillospiraceae bacterium]
MICSYVRQTSEFSPFEYFEGPEQFDTLPAGTPCCKNIVFLTQAEEEEKNLHVYSVGYEISDPEKALINRVFPAHMIIHYVVGGEGTFNDKPIKRGDCAIAFRNRSHTLCTNPKNPLRFYWIMLKHPESLSPSVFGLKEEQDVFPYRFEKQMTDILESMLHFRMGLQDPHCFFMGRFYELMSYHKQSLPHAGLPSKHHAYEKYVSLAKRMWEQTSYGLSVENVANSLGFSRKHFSLIFSAQTGMLPQQYVVEHRIRTAKIRIEAGESSLKSLALQLGYKDYPSFSRAFKKKTGTSPHDYLIRVKKQNSEIPDQIRPPISGSNAKNEQNENSNA